MISRRTIPWVTYGALCACPCIAMACSSSTSPGFTGDGGTGSTTTENNSSTNTGSGSQSTFTGSSGSTGSTFTGSGNTGAATNTGGATNNTGTGASTGTGTGNATGSAYCNNNTSPMYSTTCSAPTVGTPIALEACVPMAITNNSAGFVVAVGDGSSTACVDTNVLCAQGMTMMKNPPTYSVYGSGISISLGTAGITPTGSGLVYALTSVPTYGLQISITVGGTQYYAEVAAGSTGSGTILWSTFNTLGYNAMPDGGVFDGTSAIQSVGFQANSGTAAAAWSFCITTLTL